MKPFKELTTIDKAELLHRLFPADMNHLLTFIVDEADMIINDPSLMPEEWNRKIDLEDWQKEGEAIKEKINQHRAKMLENSTHFAETLFRGYLDFFPVQCLRDYTLLTPNQKLADAITFLFDL